MYRTYRFKFSKASIPDEPISTGVGFGLAHMRREGESIEFDVQKPRGDFIAEASSRATGINVKYVYGQRIDILGDSPDDKDSWLCEMGIRWNPSAAAIGWMTTNCELR